MRAIIPGLFTILLLGSLYFSLERVLYSDASFMVFRIVNLGKLDPQEYRFGSFITQSFPLIASKLHLPLSWIVVLYSASFNIFYLAVAAILVLKFKDYALAILMSFYFTLFVSDSFYWIGNEIHQAIGWMFLFFGLLTYFSKRNSTSFLALPVLTVIAFLAIYTHPLASFPFVFLWIFFVLEKRVNKRIDVIILSIVILIICISKFRFSAGGDHYDSQKLDAISHHLTMKKIFTSLYSPMAKLLFKKLLNVYWLVYIFFFWGLFSAIKQKKYRQLSLVIIFSLAYLAAICLVYDNFLPFYTECELQPVTIILTAAFVYFSIADLKANFIVPLLAIVFVFRLVNIGRSSEKFVERKNWIYAELKSMREKNQRKGFIYSQELKQKEFLSYWATPQESLIASALSKDKPNLTFIVQDSTELSKRLPGDPHEMLDAFQTWNIQSLNENYFQFDTTSAYQHIISLNRK